MSDQVYDWKRFWCPRSGQFDLSDRGYLTDPDSEWGKYCNSELVSLESKAEINCLVLLGEPGIGKTWELKNFRDRTQAALNGSDKLLFRDLQAYGSESELIRKLFASKTFTDWVNSTHRLHLFLDSLDEGLLKINTLSMLLVEELSNEEYREHLDRLYFRITCRTAVFPNALEEELKQLWKSLQTYELVPLRRVDVKTAAVNCGLDHDDFLRAVDHKGVVPFAIKPITLKFLINIFQRNNQQFPQSLTDLYLDGCKILCENPKDQNYHPSRRTNSIDVVEQRLIIAARIAAITIFARKFAVWMGSLGDVLDEDVLLERLCIGRERTSQGSVDVTPTVVAEILDSGLFSSRGTSRIGWAHQSYAEFLAAWYLKQRARTIDQILSLIIHPDQRVVPQLYETVAWLASLEPQVFQKIIATDPDVLLQSEILAKSDEEKSQVVASLLKLYDQGALVYQSHLPEFSPYKRWNHAELSSQVRSYICDSTRSEMSRYVAIDIAEACNVQAVQDCLANVALDSTQTYWVRVRSARAVKYLGDDKTKLRLKPLAISKYEDDSEDELKGHTLRILYPQHLTTTEVLNSITRPRARVTGGTYQDFLAREFAQHLQKSDLPDALRWLEKQPVSDDSYYPFNLLSDRILLKAWQHLDVQEVLELFSRIVLLRIRSYLQVIDSITEIEFIDLLAEDDVKRRLLLETIIKIISETQGETVYYLAGVVNSVASLERDFSWLIEKLHSSTSEQVQKTYAKLIFLKFRRYDKDQISEIITASESNSFLATEFTPLLTAIELDSPEAEATKVEYLRQQDQVRKHTERTAFILEPSPKERVLTSLEQFESGTVEAWWQLCRELTLVSASRYYGNDWKSDLTLLPGWEEASDEIRARIINAAKQYINAGDPETDAWFSTNNFPYSAVAGYKALRLVLEKEPQYVNALPAEVWKKWVSIIIYYPDSETRNEEHWKRLLCLAYQNASGEYISRLMILLDRDNAQHGDIYVSSQIECCWNERLEIALCKKLDDEKLTDKSIGSLLKLLMKRQVQSAKSFAQAQISMPLPSMGKAREIAIVAAEMLMLYADDESWALVWNASQHDLEYRKKVLEAVSFTNESQGIIEYRLCEDYIADLYLFLIKHYSDSSKAQENSQNREFNVDDYRLDAEDSVRRWRNQIPQRLQQRGTRGACEALRKIIRHLPEEQKRMLQWRLPEAEASARRKEWRPLQPEEILQLLADQEPTHVDLYNQLDTINRRTQKMADDPKIDQSIHVSNSQVNGVVGSGKIEHKIDPPSKKGVNWKFWIPILIGVAVSGLFNNEIRRFLKLDPTPPVEQKQEKSIK